MFANCLGKKGYQENTYGKDHDKPVSNAQKECSQVMTVQMQENIFCTV